MRFGPEALLVCWVCLAGSVSGCRPASGQAADTAPAHTAPPGPSAALSEVMAQSEKASREALPPGSGRALVESKCLICHGAALIQQQHKDSTGWTKTLKQMRGWGSPLTDADEPVLIDYLIKSYGPEGR
jgi:cytochrome c5